MGFRETTGEDVKYKFIEMKSSEAVFYDYKEDRKEKSIFNLLLEKVGSRIREIQNVKRKEYVLLFSDMDTDGNEKIVITVGNFGNVLFQTFHSFLGMNDMRPVNISLWKKDDKWFKVSIRELDNQMIKSKYEFDNGGFVGVPKTKWTVDEVGNNVGDDSELKAFLEAELKEWCPRVLGTPFYEMSLGDKLFKPKGESSTPASNDSKGSMDDFTGKVIAHYSTFADLQKKWGGVMKRFVDKFSDEESKVDLFCLKVISAASFKWGGEITATASGITRKEVAPVEDDLTDDLPF